MTSTDDAERWLVARRRGGRPRDPATARALLDALGLSDPPAVVHVVGTNGKGSVTHAVAAMASSAGQRVGRFTSPHVESLTERIAVDGTPLDMAHLTDFVARVRPLVEAGRLPEAGFFEWTLALALERFAARGVTLAVIEAGVGARRDATSALGNVVVSVVTNVSIDHVAALGGSLEAIAEDKAAAARTDVPLVTAATGVPLQVLRRRAREIGSEFVALADGDARFALPVGAPEVDRPETHRENLRVACATARVLAIDEAAIVAGCASPRPPARYEVFDLGGTRVILDGAHDPAAASALAASVPRPYVLVFGALARKQGAETFAPLARRAVWSIVTGADAGEPPGSWDASERLDDPVTALRRALERAGSGGTVVIAGSLYLAGRVRPELRRMAATRTGPRATR